jgi:GTP-binding protein
MLTVAIVGRPNVGKSTLFNRLAGRRLAIVHDTPGVTRDRREAEVEAGDVRFRIVDTAGFEEGPPDSISTRMTQQTRMAIEGADVALFVLDARAGVTTGDEMIAQALQRSGKHVILVANKSEGRTNLPDADAYALGFGPAIAVSAEHNQGTDVLLEALAPFLPQRKAQDEDGEDSEDVEEDEAEAEAAPDRPLRLAIVGRPNVGKSSLFNSLLGEDRALTGPEAGLTRDSIAAPWQIGGREVLLYDTAGLRRRARAAGQTLEQLSIASTLDAIRFADCVVVAVDAASPFDNQDLAIADLVEREGRAIVVAATKWDLIENKAGGISKLREQLDYLLPQVKGAPLVAVSSVTGEGLDRLRDAILEADKAWNTRIATAALNRFLEDAMARHAPPTSRGRRIRVRYMTQPKSRPPTFALFGNSLKGLPDAYIRYLTNALRETFHLGGAPIRLLLRVGKNPFADK